MTNDDILKVKKWLLTKSENEKAQVLLKALDNKDLMIGQKTHIIQKNIQPKLLSKILFGGLKNE